MLIRLITALLLMLLPTANSLADSADFYFMLGDLRDTPKYWEEDQAYLISIENTSDENTKTAEFATNLIAYYNELSGFNHYNFLTELGPRSSKTVKADEFQTVFKTKSFSQLPKIRIIIARDLVTNGVPNNQVIARFFPSVIMKKIVTESNFGHGWARNCGTKIIHNINDPKKLLISIIYINEDMPLQQKKRCIRNLLPTTYGLILFDFIKSAADPIHRDFLVPFLLSTARYCRENFSDTQANCIEKIAKERFMDKVLEDGR